MPIANSRPDAALMDALNNLERRVQFLETKGQTLTVRATDGAKVVVGVLDNTGTVGIKVYNNAGAVTYTQTAT